MGKCKQKTHKASSKVLNKKKNGTITFKMGNGNNCWFIKIAENTINKQMLQDINGYASINDFYDEIGLSRTEVGNYLGWNTENLIDLDIGAHKTEDDRPSLVIGHYNRPQYDYDR